MLSEPILEIGFFKVHMYGLMISVGVAAALFLLYFLGGKKKVSTQFLDFVFYDAIAAIVLGFASAAFFQALYDYIENPSYGFKFNGGITFIGGLIGGVIVFLVGYFIFRPRLNGRLTQMISIIPCAITIGHAFGRVGCFFAGCCYGKPTDSIFGVKFPGHLTAVHPTQLYEAIFLFILFGICLYLVMKLDFRYNMCIYLAAYGAFRFILEFFRGDGRGKFLFGLSPSQFWSIVMVIASVGVFFLLRRCFNAEPEAENEPQDEQNDSDTEDQIIEEFTSED